MCGKMDFTLGKQKRLKSRKQLENLFLKGKKIKKGAITAIYQLEISKNPGFQIAVSVPKKRFKKATDRNLLKRRIRESFRRNQNRLDARLSLKVMFIYTQNEISAYPNIEKSMLDLLEFFNHAIAENPEG